MSSEQPDTDQDDSMVPNTTRRKLMASGAAGWATVSLAGCTSNQAQQTTTTSTTTSEPETKNYVVTTDMAVGSHGVPGGHDFLSACTPSQKFTGGMQAIWYVGVYDPETGEQLTDEQLGKKGVEIQFKNRDWDPVPLAWAGDDKEHPAEEWAGSWVLPDDPKTGTVDYEVVIKNPPENAEFKPVGVAKSQFTVLEQKEAQYVISNHTYAISSPKAANGYVSTCGLAQNFTPGMTVAFQANVYDAQTGKEPGDKVIDSVMVTFPNTDQFQDFELKWQGDAKEHAVKAWEGTLDLPKDTPAGTYKYKIKVTVKGDDDANVLDTDASVVDQFKVFHQSA